MMMRKLFDFIFLLSRTRLLDFPLNLLTSECRSEPLCGEEPRVSEVETLRFAQGITAGCLKLWKSN